MALAQSLSIQGTPAYVVGNTMFSGAMLLDQLKAAIAAARARMNFRRCAARSG